MLDSQSIKQAGQFMCHKLETSSSALTWLLTNASNRMASHKTSCCSEIPKRLDPKVSSAWTTPERLHSRDLLNSHNLKLQRVALDPNCMKINFSFSMKSKFRDPPMKKTNGQNLLTMMTILSQVMKTSLCHLKFLSCKTGQKPLAVQIANSWRIVTCAKNPWRNMKETLESTSEI